MTYAPARLLEARAFLKPHTGLDNITLGIVGDEQHLGGYHHGWDQRRLTGDYSWSESTRDSSHRTNAARALDIGVFPRLRELSVWLVEQCRANAPDTRDIRELIYSPDGKTVRRWDRLGRRSTGDSSHLTHTHVSWFADAEHRDKTAVFKRFFGDDMTPDEFKAMPIAGDPGNPGRTMEQAITDIWSGIHQRYTTDIAQVKADIVELKNRPVHMSDGDRVAIGDRVSEDVLAKVLPLLDTDALAAKVADLLAARLAQ